MRILAAALLLASAAFAQDEKKADARFERFQKLAGEWAMEGDKDAKTAVTYKVTAGGSAVVETLFVGQEHEMLTVYFLDGGELRLTHYCHAKNQPSMKAAKEMKGDSLSFECTGVTGAKTHDDGHMHAMTATFSGDDTVKFAWTFQTKGKDADPVTFTLVRKKK